MRHTRHIASALILSFGMAGGSARSQEPRFALGRCDAPTHRGSRVGGLDGQRADGLRSGEDEERLTPNSCLSAEVPFQDDAAPGAVSRLASFVPAGRGDWGVLPAVHALSLVPRMNEGYVVQGVAHSCEGRGREFPCVHPRLYLSEYWLSVEGCTVDGSGKRPVCTNGDNADKRSLIVELDATTGRELRCFALLNGQSGQAYGHVGGLAYDRGSLYVASSKRVTRYVLPADIPAGGCGALAPHHNAQGVEESWLVNDGQTDSASSVMLDGRSALLVGDYRSDGHDDAATIARAYAYCEDGSLGSWEPSGFDAPHSPSCTGAFIERPREMAAFWVPGKAQGVDIYTCADGQAYFLTVRSSRTLFRYPLALARAAAPTYEQTGTLEHPQPMERVSVPPGAEDLAVVGVRIWTASESGTLQVERGRRFPWGYYPFVFAVGDEAGQESVPWEATTSLAVGKP